MKPLLSRLAAFNRAHALLGPRDRVLAAVSGGADSACLAHWLSAQRAKGRLRALTLVHFHHGLRGRAADRDAASVRAMAAALGAGWLEERPCPGGRGRARGSRTGRACARRPPAWRAGGSGGPGTTPTTTRDLLMHLLRAPGRPACRHPPRRPLAGCGPSSRPLWR